MTKKKVEEQVEEEIGLDDYIADEKKQSALEVAKSPFDVKLTDLDSFTVDLNNANLHKERGKQLVAKSMRNRGYARPAIATSDGVYIGGNLSTGEVAKQLGVGHGKAIVIETDGDIPIIHVRRDIKAGSDEARKLAIEDNRTAELSLLWSQEQIAAALDDGLLGDMFTDHELGLLLSDVTIWGDDDNSPKDDLDEYGDIIDGAMKLATRFDIGPRYDNPQNPYDLPDLRADMLAPMPDEIKVWAGPDASDNSWEGEWLYNYGTDSIRGLDLARTTLAFYTDDDRWMGFLYEPEKYVAKMLNSGIKKAITHNFSLYLDQATAFHVMNTYNTRWLGRYMQEAGIKIIPDILPGKKEAEYLFSIGLPKYPPCVSIVLQTGLKTQGTAEADGRMMEVLLDEIAPEGIIFYGGSKKEREQMSGLVPNNVRVLWLASRAHIRNKNVMKGSTSVGGASV